MNTNRNLKNSTNYNKSALITAAVVILSIGIMGNECDNKQPPEAQQRQANEARKAAASLSFTDNAEIENIKRRLEITSKPGAIGFILLMNEAGQPILYESVSGKITSGGKRLTPPSKTWAGTSGLGPAPSDEGTWGQSGEYIFYWTQNGEYRQWNGKYLYSDKPFRTRIEPLIIHIK